ncbi:MAG: phosphoribosylglycinamide formyltransferase, partial [Planctomycetales bacterium]|nr:phosphoribosylglycinamide formyltransferase [Planctomycetales bacterium]
MSTAATPLQLAVLISGGGTTLKNLLDKIAAGELEAEIRLVVSSNAAAGGLEFARQAN